MVNEIITKKFNDLFSTVRGPDFNDAPWYEILLFRTVLRFRNPNATVKLPKNLDGRPIDERPFVNTRSKVKYYTEDDAGRYFTDLYTTAWGFYPRYWFAKPLATLKLTVSAVAVIKPEVQQFADMYSPEIALSWLKHSFRDAQAFYHELEFTKVEHGHLKVEWREKSEAQAMANSLVYEPEACQINGQLAYRVQTFANQLDVYFPFTNEDLVLLSFTLLANKNITDQQKIGFIHSADEFTNSIINSVTITHSSNYLDKE